MVRQLLTVTYPLTNTEIVYLNRGGSNNASGIIEHMRLVQARPKPVVVRKKRSKRAAYVWLGVCVLVLVQYFRPLPAAVVSLQLPELPPAQAVSLAWPTQGQAAVYADGYGLLASHNDTQPIATASIAKVITALCVLEKYPLRVGEDGPNLTMTAIDVGFYQTEQARNGSRLPVYDGQQLSEYQALQAIMIPSANNIADSLALWAFKSSDAYAAYANAYLVRHGLISTRVGTDSSGFDPSTSSTATDLAALGALARKNPVLMEIAGQKSVNFPGVGEYFNYNSALGVAGITGLKTGNNDQNPGGLLFTADAKNDRGEFHLSGAVLGAASLSEAIEASETLVASTATQFESVAYVKAGQQVGTAQAKWGARVPVQVKTPLVLTRWKSQAMTKRHTIHAVSAGARGEVGALSIRAGEVQSSATLTLPQELPGPSFWWRLTRL